MSESPVAAQVLALVAEVVPAPADPAMVPLEELDSLLVAEVLALVEDELGRCVAAEALEAGLLVADLLALIG